jgi:hypothetical protein
VVTIGSNGVDGGVQGKKQLCRCITVEGHGMGTRAYRGCAGGRPLGVFFKILPKLDSLAAVTVR